VYDLADERITDNGRGIGRSAGGAGAGRRMTRESRNLDEYRRIMDMAGLRLRNARRVCVTAYE
jgi:hypothetical protein